MTPQQATRANAQSGVREVEEESPAALSGFHPLVEAGRINRLSLNHQQLPLQAHNIPYPTSSKGIVAALIGMLFLGGGTAYGTVSSIQTKDEMRDILAAHMKEGHPEIKEMERSMIELQFMVKELKVLNDRMVRRADLTLLLVFFNQEMVEYIENGRKGQAPVMPPQIKQLQFELIR